MTRKKRFLLFPSHCQHFEFFVWLLCLVSLVYSLFQAQFLISLQVVVCFPVHLSLFSLFRCSFVLVSQCKTQTQDGLYQQTVTLPEERMPLNLIHCMGFCCKLRVVFRSCLISVSLGPFQGGNCVLEEHSLFVDCQFWEFAFIALGAQ